MKITIRNDMTDPEINAMLQAFYSRSHMGINERIAELGGQPEKIKNSLQQYYLGYGHSSIGDCGWTTLYIEGVSLLAAKAIQHHPLYNGQEKSTRYLNFVGDNLFYNPLAVLPDGQVLDSMDLVTDVGLSNNYLYSMIDWYNQISLELINELTHCYPKPDKLKGSVYKNSIQCAAFDVARGFLPAGLKTSLSWTGHLRSIREHCKELLQHPLLEVRNIAKDILRQCYKNYPATFSLEDENFENEYVSICTKRERLQLYYQNMPSFPKIHLDQQCFNLNLLLLQAKNELIQRPQYTALPRYVEQYGTITAKFWLDFGSFRDLQRHRNGTCVMSEFDPYSKMHPFYLSGTIKNLFRSDQYDKFTSEYMGLLSNLIKFNSHCSSDDLQYLYPLGWLIPVSYTATLPQWVYMVELRTQPSVHPTLRSVMMSVAKELKNIMPFMKLYVDLDEHPVVNWPRGNQTIWRTDEKSTG